MSANLQPAAVSSLMAWKKEQLVETKRREEVLAAWLRAVVPENLHKWLKEDTVVENLVEYGRSSRKYCRDGHDGDSYGYTDIKEFARRLKKLAKTSWKGVVTISIGWDGDYRFEAYFIAI